MTIFDILNNISHLKVDVSEHESFEKIYNIFLINRFLSMLPETVFYAQYLAKYDLTKKEHYLFLLKTLPKRKRYFKYEKGVKVTENIEIISKYFQVNELRALELSEFFNEVDLSEMQNCFEMKINRR